MRPFICSRKMSFWREIQKAQSAAMAAVWLWRLVFAIQPPSFGSRCLAGAVQPRWLWLRSASSERPQAARAAAGFSRSLFDGNKAPETVRWCGFGALNSLSKTGGNAQTGAAVWFALCAYGQALNRFSGLQLCQIQLHQHTADNQGGTGVV